MFGGQLESLAFSTCEGGQHLTESEVLKAHVAEPVEDTQDWRLDEVVECIRDAHLKDVRDALALDRVRLGIRGEPASVTDLASSEHAFHECEVGVDDSVTLAL